MLLKSHAARADGLRQSLSQLGLVVSRADSTVVFATDSLRPALSVVSNGAGCETAGGDVVEVLV